MGYNSLENVIAKNHESRLLSLTDVGEPMMFKYV